MSDGPSVLVYGDRALLVELGDTERVVAWVEALRQRRLEGVVDVIPAAETVLVVADEHTRTSSLRGALMAIDAPPLAPGTDHADAVQIPVQYDGPDLADVARLTGLSEQQVVEAHTGQTWRVAFSGFAPGFGYLVGADSRLHVPRRDSARTAVPAGAVGLAGEFSGVYPRESPGGWQLIGTTSAVMWATHRDPPALLRPGARVRFVSEGAR